MNEETKAFECRTCGAVFTTKLGLSIHKGKLKHFKEDTPTQDAKTLTKGVRVQNHELSRILNWFKRLPTKTAVDKELAVKLMMEVI
jgi:hypothetical protein